MIPSMQGRCDYYDNGQGAIYTCRENLRMQKQSPGIPFWNYTLILLDYSMPKIDGPATAVEVCRMYKEAGVELPHIVCLTAFTEKIF
jgi:CheY-like chemotaxis protein